MAEYKMTKSERREILDINLSAEAIAIFVASFDRRPSGMASLTLDLLIEKQKALIVRKDLFWTKVFKRLNVAKGTKCYADFVTGIIKEVEPEEVK